MVVKKADRTSSNLRSLIRWVTEADIGVSNLVASYWLSFAYARNPRALIDGRILANGAFYVISIAAPYLARRERELFDELAKRYLH